MGIMRLYAKYIDIVLYAIFGLLTTVTNVLTYWFMARFLEMGTMASAIIAWAAAVLFAYGTNRRWVFHSRASTRMEVAKEMASFFLCRLATGAVDWGLMFFCVELLLWNDIAVKTAANVIVIILNFVFSKLIVFKRREV